VFPLYHVLADYGEWRGETVLVPSRSSRPLAVEALVVRTNAGQHALVANLTAEPQRCSLEPLDGSEVALRVLDETTLERALDDPEAFRAERGRHPVAGGRLDLELGPYSVVRIDPQ